MNKEFVPYSEALALKELGFDEPCFGWYDSEYQDIINHDRTTNSCGWLNGSHCSAPLYQQVFRWFREKGFHSAIMPKITPSNITVYYIYEGKPKKDWNNCFKTYEKAKLACLIKLIEIVKNKS